MTGKWIQYDDSHPSLQREEDITKLSGGGKTQWLLNRTSKLLWFSRFNLIRFLYVNNGFTGDWHMAYIIMYKARFVSM